MSEIRILIVVKDAETASAYVDAVTESGATCDVAHSFQEMSALATDRVYNGIVVDILTLVRCSKEEKVIAYEIINLFPVLRVKWEPRHKKIKLTPLEQSFSPDTDSALRFFIQTRCKAFPARSLRKEKRKLVNLNLLYCRDNRFLDGEACKSFTINISPTGVFLHTMEEFRVGETIWLRFLEFADQTPVEATVCWSQRWGVTRCVPGAGVKFESLTESQRQDVDRIVNL
ncbi:PilZ domain protein [Citrifermentans bemidjiense Bem]|uniref:PilZ domain protein n=1 Tax=Citrifermentans bemidjiense (strain ATCC BAA-1014 / DSM 16622 / JCM 12645 / Bem) TaxID=404380 RepID=B5EE08_CITBB|nr:PilZ domain-containing protein [Citrifermentans bemidjiense]ACH37746.1 PilZ domain protein [Citrifermentans bemidjiense Bem]